MFPYYFSWLIFMLMCIYFHSEVIIKRVSENFVLVLFLGWNTCNWNMITSILCILDLSWTAKADLMAPVCSGGFQWFFYYYYLLFKLRFIMITIADFWEGTVREQFQVFKINTLWSSLCLHSCVASCACWSYTDLSFQGLHMLGRSQEASGVFLETSGCFFWRCRKAVFSLESQTEEDLIVVIQPWISTDTFWWAELFLVLRRKFWGNGFFFSGPLGMHASTITVLQKQDERGESFQNWRGLSSVLAADFFDL